MSTPDQILLEAEPSSRQVLARVVGESEHAMILFHTSLAAEQQFPAWYPSIHHARTRIGTDPLLYFYECQLIPDHIPWVVKELLRDHQYATLIWFFDGLATAAANANTYTQYHLEQGAFIGEQNRTVEAAEREWSSA